MQIHSLGREYYAIELVTTPSVAAWEASFDLGTTWVAGSLVSGAWRWLVAGPAVTAGSGATILAGSVRPLVRAVDNPEIIVRDAPAIRIV